MSSYLPSIYEFIAILMMASITFFTRISGYLFLRNKTLSKRTQDILSVAPVCVMASIVGTFITSDPVMLFSLAIGFVCAIYTNFVATVLIAVAANALLQLLLI